MDSRTQAQSRVPRSAQETNHDNILVSVFNHLEAFFSLIFSTWLASRVVVIFLRRVPSFAGLLSRQCFSHTVRLSQILIHIFSISATWYNFLILFIALIWRRREHR